MADLASEATETGDAAAAPAAAEPSNEELLAELTAEQGTAVQPAKPAVRKPVADDDADTADDDDDEVETADVGDDDPDPDPDDDDAASDDEDDEVETEETTATAPDPALKKRLDAVTRTEQRQRAALERDRAAFALERTEWQQQGRQLLEHKQRFDSLAARAKYDSYSVLRELGVADEDMEIHAQHLYSRSKSAAVKPEHRAAADRSLREREVADKATKAETEVEKLRGELAEREQRAAADREIDVHLARVLRKAGEDAPLTKALIAKNPRKAREALMVTTAEVARKLGGVWPPKASAVIAAHERKERRELRDRGIEPPARSGAAPAPAPAPAAKAAPAAAPAKPKAGAKATPAPASTVLANGVVYHPSNDELLRELRSGVAAEDLS